MKYRSRHRFSLICLVFLLFFWLLCSPVFSMRDFTNKRQDNQTFQQDDNLKMKLIKDMLTKINKPHVKSIQSPDGDIIDCVLFHLQPAFDHPNLKGTIPMISPEIPNGMKAGMVGEINQLWSSEGESCPNGTIPIRRTNEQDILRSTSMSKFRKKYSSDSVKNGHEHAIGYVRGEKYYGAKATLNLWGPNVTKHDDFSISQIWIIGHTDTIEAGWQISPKAYGDNSPRLFTYWSSNRHRSGCYNLWCSGFVQTNKFPISIYNGSQFDITFLIWKDIRSGDWWLNVGSILVGYWPEKVFQNLGNYATRVEFGGQVFNSQLWAPHTSTQMGSGHFPDEGYRKAAFIKNIGVVDANNTLIPVSNVGLIADRSKCYDVTNGFDDDWGNFIFFGGPGNNPNCK